ncbi:MAG: tRNA (adenine-N1)-methyltransferase, partial [Chloroflexota bacterium]|nr:tRNA (adenine-N1)-methyltransferase [Chloroflexota bacterium]
LAQAHAALKGSGFFGSLVPTANQLTDLLREMDSLGGWTDVEVVEILMRQYKPVADRLRPEDRMVAHTGYLLFARAVMQRDPEEAQEETKNEDEQTESA